MIRRPPRSTRCPYTTLFRSGSTSAPGVPSPRRPPCSPSGCGVPQIGRAQSELQSRGHLVCRLLLEKKKKIRCPVKQPEHRTTEPSRPEQAHELPAGRTVGGPRGEHDEVERHDYAAGPGCCPLLTVRHDYQDPKRC